MELEVKIPTQEEEFNYLWKVLQQDIPFCAEHSEYGLKLPPLFFKDLNYLFTNPQEVNKLNYNELQQTFFKKIYDKNIYQNGYERLAIIKKKLLPFFNTLQNWNINWKFKIFPKYILYLTLYGTGGSYNDKTGNIIMMTDQHGNFKKEPLGSILHEITHIGIEDLIVQKYNLTHKEKERLVDILCSEYLKIPNYRLGDYRNPELDKYIQNIDLKDLPKQIEKYKSIYQLS